MDILTLTNVTKTFGTRTILDNVSFNVAAGSSVAITGRSGSGKSTLLNIIGMLETYDSGTIILDGVKLPRINSKAAMLLRRKTISYLFQSFALIPGSSVKANLLLGMHYAPGSKLEKTKRLEAMLERLQISHLKDQKVKTLSGGEQQRVALARCILKPGELILADEPTGALDKELAHVAVTELLQLQKEYNKTLVMVTHDPDIAVLCDQQLQIK